MVSWLIALLERSKNRDMTTRPNTPDGFRSWSAKYSGTPMDSLPVDAASLVVGSVSRKAPRPGAA